MRLLFTSNDRFLSKLIRKGLQEPISHLAIASTNGAVFHATMQGVEVISLREFLKDNDIVYTYKLSCAMSETDTVQFLLDNCVRSQYDIGALFYLGWRTLLRLVFRVPFPKRNRMDINSAYLCTEIVKYVKDPIFTKKIEGIDLAMTTPYGLYKLLIGKE